MLYLFMMLEVSLIESIFVKKKFKKKVKTRVDKQKKIDQCAMKTQHWKIWLWTPLTNTALGYEKFSIGE